MTELTLTAVYEEAEEGGYIGYVAELPGANTQGETLEEVRENLIGLYRSSQLAIGNRQSI
jgi:predicted RNase H-like HicB family nuclease